MTPALCGAASILQHKSSHSFDSFRADGMFHAAGVLLRGIGIDPHNDQAPFQDGVSFQHPFSRFPSLIGKAEQLVGSHRQKAVRSQTLDRVACTDCCCALWRQGMSIEEILARKPLIA